MRRLAIALAVVGLVGSACGQPPPGGGATSAPTGTAAATATPTRGGTAIVAIWQFPSTLAAHYANQTVTDIVNNGVIEGLAETNTNGEYVPTLATKVPTVGNGGAKVSADGKKLDVTWELKPGIKWSDGTAVTSADIKYTWEIWMKDPKVNNRTGFSEIESIDTPNELTAVVHYKSVYAAYPLNFFSLMPKHLLEKEADISRTDYVRKPLGTGPYKVTDFKTDESVTLERNTNYRDSSKPYLDKVIFKSVPSSQVGLAQLKAGEVHAMWNLTEAQTPEVEKESALSLLVVQGPTVERIELNTAQNKEYPDPNSVHPVLGDIEVRKALLYATPKQQIIDKLLFGKAKPGSSPVSQGWAAYKEPQEGYDPAKANAALDKAGWVKGSDGIRSKGGVRASLTYATTTGDQLRERVQQVLVDEWKNIGIEVKIQNQPSAVILSGSCSGKDPRKLGTFDLLMYASTPSIDPHSTILPRYHSKQIPTQADCAGQNYTRFKNTQADAAIERAGATLDQEQRKTAYAQVMKALNEAYVIIWMYDRANIDARRTELLGWEGNTWRRFTWNIQNWYLKK
ncbi:MAG TPA: peptide ABC transporter substrate-binding protein [Candidatus Limnocylindria bacterium]|nr:peptide ABC transporter substrate-binding protein [Candidatus Limnocylindria bacterium]